MKTQYTTQAEIRDAFWNCRMDADPKQITDHSGNGKMYKADTRVAFVDFVDELARSGHISEALAFRATL